MNKGFKVYKLDLQDLITFVDARRKKCQNKKDENLGMKP